MAPTAADIPSRYDVIIDGTGFRFADALDSEIGAYSLGHATYEFSPTFVTRQNVQGDYGDNQQDFWLTMSQNDWSLGQQQRYFRTDIASKRRFWKGQNVNVREAGQVTIRPAVTATTPFASAAKAIASTRGSIYVATDTNLYAIDGAGAVTLKGAHGAGTVGLFGLTADMSFVYIAGTTKIRKYGVDTTAFSDFSASLADSIAFLNNSLYGFRQANGDLVSWTTAGVISTGLSTWKGADGTIFAQRLKLLPYGGKLLALRVGEDWGPQLWVYDGTGTSMLAHFPPTFSPHDMCEVAGTLFVSGLFVRVFGGVTQFKPVIFYYTNSGQMNVLWQGYDWAASIGAPGMCPFEDGLAFADTQQNKLAFFDPTSGGIHPLGTLTGANFAVLLAANGSMLAVTRSDTTLQIFPGNATATSAQVDLSLADLDTSLTKYFKGVKIDAEIPSGATVDIYYLLNDLSQNLVANYVMQPNFEAGTANQWGNLGAATIAADNAVGAQAGTWAGKITWGSSASGTVYHIPTVTANELVQGAQFGASLYVKGVGSSIGKSVTVQLNESGGALGDAVIGSVTVVLSGSYQRVSCSGSVSAADRTGFYVAVTGSLTAADVVAIDNVQMERGLTATAYKDGSTAGYSWEGGTNATRTLGDPYVLVQASAGSGQEYPINQQGRALSVRVVLNKGSSTAGPILKRVYVRAVPIQATFRRREYVIELSGRDGEQMMEDRAGMSFPTDGHAQAAALLASAIKQAPVPIIDRFGSYNGVIDLENSHVRELRPEEYYARIVVRETG